LNPLFIAALLFAGIAAGFFLAAFWFLWAVEKGERS
jgi:hypothetical protein